jgi:hypothetical protein
MSTSWSFEGQDRLAASLLRTIDQGLYFDIGCAHPINISNTFYFYERGWRGLAVDGRDLRADWEADRPGDQFEQRLLGDGSAMTFAQFPDPYMSSCDPTTVLRYASRFDSDEVKSSVVETVRADWLWRCFFPDRSPDLVNLDVEGCEMTVLRGFDFIGARPKLFIVELKLFNFMKPQDHPVVDFFYSHSYCLAAKTPLDGLFVDRLNPCFDWLPKEMLFDAK